MGGRGYPPPEIWVKFILPHTKGVNYFPLPLVGPPPRLPNREGSQRSLSESVPGSGGGGGVHPGRRLGGATGRPHRTTGEAEKNQDPGSSVLTPPFCWWVFIGHHNYKRAVVVDFRCSKTLCLEHRGTFEGGKNLRFL